MFAGALDASSKVKFPRKRSQRHRGGFSMALLCRLQAGFRKPLGGTVSLRAQNRRVIVGLRGPGCTQGFAAVKNVQSEGKRPLHRAACYPESCSEHRKGKHYA